jgi:hypothetical protein
MNQKEKERQEAISELQEILKPGDTLYTILRHVSRSGMLRHISLFSFKSGEPLQLDYLAARALGWSLAKGDGIKIDGAGMDMGFHLVYCLAATLFPGYDESGKSGGYALSQRWL